MTHRTSSSARASAAAASALAQVAPLRAASSQLQGAASLMTQTLVDLDGPTAAQTADVADSANQAAGLSQQLATVATGTTPSATSRASVLADQLRGALTATQAKAAVVSRAPITFPITFCNFTIQIGPIIIDIPRFHIHIVIGPFFIHFRAPCFLSGILPHHVP